LTVRAAEVLLATKAKKEAEELQKKQEREYKRLWNIEKKIKYTEGVTDRKAERERKKRVRELIQGGRKSQLSYKSLLWIEKRSGKMLAGYKKRLLN
jgi:hypothetical protein